MTAVRRHQRGSADCRTRLFEPSELSALAARAASLEERFSGLVRPIADGPDPGADVLFESWKSIAGGGTDSIFAKVLDVYGVTADEARRVLGAVEWAADVPLPDWTTTFAAAAEALAREPDEATVARLKPQGRAAPFESLFYPLLAAVRRWRDERADPAHLALLSPAAATALDRALLGPLASVCARALNDRLSSHMLGLSLAGGRPPESTQAEIIEAFIRRLRADGLKKLFVERPVLARLIAVASQQWIDASLEFLERLARDLDGPIASLAGSASRPRRVERIRIGLSDLHNGGRSVIKVIFDTGLTLGYKPKDLRVDLAFDGLLRWLDERGAPPSASLPATRARDGYGWVEWLEPSACADRDEAAIFFRRSGAMLCLLRVLQGNDFHFENVLACGPVPCPVDLETVVHPRQSVGAGATDAETVLIESGQRLLDSVIAVGFLPQWLAVAGGGALLAGGLDAEERAVRGDRNTGLRLASEAGGGAARSNVPNMGGVALDAARFETDLVAGYREMFAFLRANAGDLAAADGPLAGFAGVTIRPVLRATQFYAYLQSRSLGRKATVNGAAWSQHFDFLYRTSHGADGRALPLAQACRYEARALARFDIPSYAATPDGTALRCGDGTELPGYFPTSCLDDIRTRLASLDEGFRNRDETLIRQALRLSRPAVETGGPEFRSSADGDPRPVGPVAAAHDLARTLCAAAIRCGDAAAFIGPVAVGSDERAQQVSVLGGGLLNGSLGVALFLAAMYRVTGEESLRSDVDRLLCQTDLHAKEWRSLAARRQPIDLGLANGVGGTVYGLVALSVLLDDLGYAERAGTILQTVTPEALATDRNFSLYGGAAGLAAGATALCRLGGQEAASARPILAACVDHLLDHQRSHPRGGACWLRPGRTDGLIGYMQGTSGIAQALAQAAPDHRADELLAAAQAALTYERAVAAERSGYPDLRDKVGAPLRGFANGAAGAGLARIAMQPWGIGLRHDELAWLAEIAGADLFAPTDDLFAGNFGRLLFLQRAAAVLSDADLADQAAAALVQRLSAAERAGSFAWRAGADGDNPGLFNGAAGVGLTLLHLAAPDRVPDFATLPVDLSSF